MKFLTIFALISFAVSSVSAGTKNPYSVFEAYFAFENTYMSDNSLIRLESFEEIFDLCDGETLSMRIDAHADASEAEPKKISRKRAKHVKEQFLRVIRRYHIEPQIRVLGKSQLREENDGDEKIPTNRRVDVFVSCLPL